MLIYGKNVLKEIDKTKIKKIYVSSNEVVKFLKENKLKYDFVPKKVLDNMVKGNHQGVVIDILDYDYYEFDKIDSNVVVILDHLEDPHNFGSIIRTCECLGIENIIIPKDRSVIVNDTVVKVSTGAIQNVKITRVSNLCNSIKKLQNKGYFVYAASMEGKPFTTVDYSRKKCIVIGNEGKGIQRLIKDISDEIISIPLKGKTNSLNASVAAAILLYGITNESNI